MADECSLPFFDEVRDGRLRLVTSALVQAELADAPPDVRQSFDDMLSLAEIVDVSAEALELQQAYVDAGIIRPAGAPMPCTSP